MQKPAVREMALENGLKVHDKKDSTGICFIGERNFREFLGEYIPARPGLIKSPGGEVLGEHSGLMFHTLGQRQGLGIGGVNGFADAPWYVLHKDLENNVLYAGQGHDHPWLFSSELGAEHLNWVTGQPPSAGSRLTAKVRYRQSDQQCEVLEINDRKIRIRFRNKQRAVTPGQSVVLYSDDECLGGGIIETMNAIPFIEGPGS